MYDYNSARVCVKITAAEGIFEFFLVEISGGFVFTIS